MSGDGADDGLGEPQPLVEAGLVGQEAVAVGVDQLHELERLAPVPGRGGGEQRPSRRGRRARTGSAARCRAGRRARRRSGCRCRRGSRSPTSPIRPAGGDRLQPEHDDVGEADVGREPDRVRVAGPRRVGGPASGGTGSTAKPSVSIIHSIFSACGRWKSGSSTPDRPVPDDGCRRYRPRLPCTGSCFRPRWLAFHLLVVGAIVLMVNLGFWQLRRLDERQAFNDRVASRIDLPPVPLDDVLSPAPTGRRWSGGRSAARASTCPTSRSSSSTARRAGSPATSSSRRCSSTTGGCCSSSAASCRSAPIPPPPPAGEVDVVGRLRPSQERRRGQLSDPRPAS